MARCDLTGRGTQTGNNRSHAMNATRRTFKINTQTFRYDDAKFTIGAKEKKTLGKDDPKVKKLIKKLGITVKNK